MNCQRSVIGGVIRSGAAEIRPGSPRRSRGWKTLASRRDGDGGKTFAKTGGAVRAQDARGQRAAASFLQNRAPDVFNYLRHPHIDATNWRAEQAIRAAVVNRKVWCGNRTPTGADAQGILMSVLRTAAQHGKDVLEFLAQILRAPPGRAPRPIAATC